MQHELEKFLAVVEYGSFTAAARQLRISQPALTAAMNILETRFGTVLINRNTRPLQLTKAGQAVYASASRLRFELNKLDNRLKDLRNDQTIKSSIGAIDSVAGQLFKSGVNPNHLEVHVDNTARLIEAVRLDRIDMAFVSEPLVAPGGNVVIEPLYSEGFTFITHPSNAEVVISNLRDHRTINDFVTYNPESTTFQRITATLKAKSIQTRVTFVSTSPEIIMKVVLGGHGSALIPATLASEDIKQGKAVQIPGVAFLRPIALARRSGEKLTSLHRQLIRSLQDSLPTSPK